MLGCIPGQNSLDKQDAAMKITRRQLRKQIKKMLTESADPIVKIHDAMLSNDPEAARWAITLGEDLGYFKVYGERIVSDRAIRYDIFFDTGNAFFSYLLQNYNPEDYRKKIPGIRGSSSTARYPGSGFARHLSIRKTGGDDKPPIYHVILHVDLLVRQIPYEY